MKRKLISMMAAVSVLVSAAPSLAADTDSEYATREYVVSEFVQSVGRNNLESSAYMLSTFEDADEIDADYINDFEKAVANGLIRGYDDKTLKPRENITRVEALMIFSRCIPETDDVEGEAIKFTDVPEWAEDTINGLSKVGIVKGYGDGRLGAQDNITVEQVKLLTDRSDKLLNTVPVGESFYGYINNKAFRNAQLSSSSTIDAKHGAIIEAEDAWSHFGDTQNFVDEKETELLEKLMNGELKYENGSAEQRVHDMLLCIQNASNATEGDKKIVKEMRDRIIGAKTVSELLAVSDELTASTGIQPFFAVMAQQDPDTNLIYPNIGIGTSGTAGIINYRKSTKDAFSGVYESAIKDAMKSIGFDVSDEDVKNAIEIQAVTDSDTDFAPSINFGLMLRTMIDPSFTQDDIAAEMDKLLAEHPELDPVTYGTDKPACQKYTADEINKIFTKINLSDVLKSFGFEKADTLYTNTEDAVKALDKLITEKNLNALKINALLNLADMQCFLSEDEENAFGALDYVSMAAMSFIEGDDPPTQDDTNSMMYILNSMFGMDPSAGEEDEDPDDILSAGNLNTLRTVLPNDIALIYCDYYYDDRTSEDIAEIVDEIWEEYIDTFTKNTWMDDNTKQNAINKIENMIAVIGYPDNYEFPTIVSPENGGTFFTNYLNVMQDNLNTVRRQCDDDLFMREQMLSAPDMVNAFYAPTLNIMNIFAGILQPPFYDPEASRAHNLGAIGAIIGHEIGHAFDADGAQYDENGCLKNWWTEKDAEEFDKRKNSFIEYYKNFSVVDGLVQDSELTIGENMADFAGMRCVLNILEGDKEAQKEAMEAWASVWAQLGTEKYVTSTYAMNDVHSANNVRVDGVIASMDEFYEIYDISEDDPMYVAPENRLKLW